MNIASLERCKELYELSFWDGLYSGYYRDDGAWRREPSHNFKTPAYDIGYLLRKLPSSFVKDDKLYCFSIMILGDHTYTADYWKVRDGFYMPFFGRMRTGDDTPEDALCKLAIELFKQGILPKSPKEDPLQGGNRG